MLERTRDEIDDKYKWDLCEYFKNDDEFLAEVKQFEKDMLKLKNYKDHVLDSPSTLYETIKLNESLSQTNNLITIYAFLKFYENTANQDGKELTVLAQNVSDKFLSLSSFIIPEILKSDYKDIVKWQAEYPKLNQYKFYLEKLFREQSHHLSDREEKILGEFNSCFDSFETMFTELVSSEIDAGTIETPDGKEVKVNFANSNELMRVKDRTFREKAYKQLWNAYSKNGSTLSNLLINSLSVFVKIAKIRGFNSVLDKALFEDNVNKDVYDNIVSATENHTDLYAKFFQIRKDKLGLNELKPWDLGVQLTSETIKKYTVEDAQNVIIEALKPLGEEYQKILDKAFKEKWIDFLPAKNKYNGWFTWGPYDKHPVILANYKGEAYDISGLSHELGHAINDYYSFKNNNYYEAYVPLFGCEAVSLLNEMLVQNYLLEHSQDRNEKIQILESILRNINTNLFSVIMENNFEKYIYDSLENGESLSDQKITDKYMNEMNKFRHGVVESDPSARHSWIIHNQLFEQYYLYKYTVGIIGACYLMESIKTKQGLERYLEYLKLGDSNYPLEMLKKAGIDLKDPKIIDNVFIVYERYLNQYENLLNS